jgi:hypothetical protein
VTGNVTSGSKVVTGLSESLAIGTEVQGGDIPAKTLVRQVTSETEVELTQAATGTQAGDALTASAPAQCDDGVAPAVGPEHPEADPGHLCVFLAGATPKAAAANVSEGTTLNIGLGSSFASGAATAGARVILSGNAEVEEGNQFWGTWAVTAP